VDRGNDDQLEESENAGETLSQPIRKFAAESRWGQKKKKKKRKKLGF
jgi:hypothetical protein